MAKSVLAIALGNRTTRAVLLEPAAEGVRVAGHWLLPAPALNDLAPKQIEETYANHFRVIRQSAGAKADTTVLVLNRGDSIFRLLEMPELPVVALRSLLETDAVNYLQQEHTDWDFDCLPLREYDEARKKRAALLKSAVAGDFGDGNGSMAAQAPRAARRMPTLVGGAPRDVLKRLQKAARQAGLQVVQATSALMAVYLSLRERSASTPDLLVVAVDLGFEHTDIYILHQGELLQSRTIAFGGHQITAGLAAAMKVAYEAAESVKMVMPYKVEAKLRVLISPLVQEVHDSIAFLENQYDLKAGEVLFSGAAASSSLLLSLLEKTLQIACKPWVPLPSPLLSEEDQSLLGGFSWNAPQLIAAYGAGAAWLRSGSLGVNLLAPQQEAERQRRRNPVRLAFYGACLLLALMFIWSAVLGWNLLAENSALQRYQNELVALAKRSAEAAGFVKAAAANQAAYRELTHQAATRFLAAPVLNALQQCMVEDIVVTGLSMEKVAPASPLWPSGIANGSLTERQLVVLEIEAKDYSDLTATDQFIDTLAAHPFFKLRLARPDAVFLKNRQPRQPDPSDPTRSFALMTIECFLIQ